MFDVAPSRRLGLPGMTAQVHGSLSCEGNCPVLVPEEVGSGILVFPWAVVVRYADGTLGAAKTALDTRQKVSELAGRRHRPPANCKLTEIFATGGTGSAGILRPSSREQPPITANKPG